MMMLFVTGIMYVSATVHWVTCLTEVACIFNHECGLAILLTPHGTVRQIIVGLTININFMLSDIIVLWRAWVLWERRRGVLLISAILSMATIAAAIASATIGQGVPVSSSSTTPAMMAVTILSLVTNSWATALVACKAWVHRRRLRTGGRRTKVGLTLLVLVESGLLYCTFWILVILSSKALLGPVSSVVAESIVQVAGIYPTIVAVVVCLQKMQTATHTQHDEPSVLTTHLTLGLASGTQHPVIALQPTGASQESDETRAGELPSKRSIEAHDGMRFHERE
ncbi:hypothetical protein BV25DRAFT_1420855 [Artomyces pyxidatus]|uniref:Uncharacterized protein n=1 Tax=Artomyces pyxidatus TaxID=48021 RepID=A0ACB8TE77_9AGAM|nr:hypothetical protein BV25DRAFT_1420855 [Artomyces pyxidatus]